MTLNLNLNLNPNRGVISSTCFHSRMLHLWIYVLCMLHSSMFKCALYQSLWSGKTSGKVYIHTYITHIATICGLIELIFLRLWFNFEPCVSLIYEYQCPLIPQQLIIWKNDAPPVSVDKVCYKFVIVFCRHDCEKSLTINKVWWEIN